MFNVAPSFNKLGSPRMKADGFASKMALAARPSTALSCDCVTEAAMSASDCPGLTEYWVAAEPAVALSTADAAAGAAGALAVAAGAAQAGDMPASPANASQTQAIASGTARRVERVVMAMSRAFKRVFRGIGEKAKIAAAKKKASRQGDAFRWALCVVTA